MEWEGDLPLLSLLSLLSLLWVSRVPREGDQEEDKGGEEELMGIETGELEGSGE